MDKWTCYPCHLNTCSLRLICKPKWFSSLTNISKKFFFPFWKIWPPSLPCFKLRFGNRLRMEGPRVPCLNHQGPPPSPFPSVQNLLGDFPKPKKLIALHIFIGSCCRSSCFGAWRSIGTNQNQLNPLIIKVVKTTLTFWHVIFYNKVGTDRKWL